MLKSVARKEYLKKKSLLQHSERAKADDLLLINFQQLALPPVYTLLTYAAIAGKHEISTDAIVDYMAFQNPGLQVCYPVCNLQTWAMHAVATNEHTVFAKNKVGIPEPEGGHSVQPQDIDMVLVPLLCFDEDGYRVGYGKGMYDKFFHNTSPHLIKIGLSYFEPIDKIEDRNQFDIPLNYCITPQRIYEF